MIRNLVIVLLSVGLLGCLYAGVYHWRTAETNVAMRSDHPELEWLRKEYELSGEQFTTIRTKHEAHDVICRKLCMELVEAQKTLDFAIATFPKMGPEVRAALAEWTDVRQRCREATIAHMYDVSSVMSDEAAARYRKRIFENLILPGQMPHIDSNGEFREELIEYAAPESLETTPRTDD